MAAFWAVTLYGGQIIRYASPVIVVTMLILGMYARRYSPLSSTARTGEKHGHKRESSDPSSVHNKTLDEIVETFQELTMRCNILLEPFLSLTDFLSSQRTPTSATTRPALTTLFIRILLVTPLWIAFTLPPFYIITTRRVMLFIGTTILTWHSRPARVTRTVLWRSAFIHRLSSFVTGLDFATPHAQPSSTTDTAQSQSHLATLKATHKAKTPASSGVRFTFILYENQRRWIGLGWTTSLFAYERGPWTDEHLNPAESKDEFELPEVDGGAAKWRWISNSDWSIERGDAKQHARSISTGSRTGAAGSTKDEGSDADGGGWIYYDNRWEDGKREDGWGKYTRRRKWYRNAELVESLPSQEPNPVAIPKAALPEKAVAKEPEIEKSEGEEEKIRKARAYAKGLSPTSATVTTAPTTPSIPIPGSATESASVDDPGSITSALSPASASAKKRGWFGRNRSDSKSSSSKNTNFTQTSTRSRDGPDDDYADKWKEDMRHRGFSVQEDVAMSLG